MTDHSLTDLLAGRDRWDGAACIGVWSLFDPRGESESVEEHALRIQHARAICTSCQLLEQCYEIACNMRPRDRTGVWAGVPYDHRGRPVRTPKETSK